MIRTDGTWDPSKRGGYFLAGSFAYASGGFENLNRYKSESWNLFAVNDFCEPGKPISTNGMWKEFQASLRAGCPTFLDSGIFYLTNVHKRAHGCTMDEALALAPEEIDNFDWLFDVYVTLVSEYRDVLWGYNELDQGGMVNKRRTRQRLHDLGLNPIPVYHPLNDGWDYFDELATGYDRICWGNVVQANRQVRLRMLATAAERHREYPDLWIHFLGLSPNEIQFGIPFDSADSSTWTAAFRYPQAVRLQGMGRRLVQLPVGMRLPRSSSIDDEDDTPYRDAAGNITCADSFALARSLYHWRQALLNYVGMTELYPTGDDQ